MQNNTKSIRQYIFGALLLVGAVGMMIHSLNAFTNVFTSQDPVRVAQRHYEEAQTLYAKGNIDKALETALKSEDGFVLARQHNSVIAARLLLGQIYHAHGNNAQAVHFFGQALQWAKDMEDPLLEGSIFRGITQIYAQAGDHEKAIKSAVKAGQSFVATQRPHLTAVMLIEAGDALLQSPKSTDTALQKNAYALYKKAFEIYQKTDTLNAAIALSRAGETLIPFNEAEAAVHIDEAAILFRRAGRLKEAERLFKRLETLDQHLLELKYE